MEEDMMTDILAEFDSYGPEDMPEAFKYLKYLQLAYERSEQGYQEKKDLVLGWLWLEHCKVEHFKAWPEQGIEKGIHLKLAFNRATEDWFIPAADVFNQEKIR